MKRILILFFGLLNLLFIAPISYAEQAQTVETTTTSTTQTPNGPVTIERHVITTTVPAPKAYASS